MNPTSKVKEDPRALLAEIPAMGELMEHLDRRPMIGSADDAEFRISRLIDEAAEACESPDPGDVCDYIAAQIESGVLTVAQLRAGFMQMLRGEVVRQLGDFRRAAMAAPSDDVAPKSAPRSAKWDRVARVLRAPLPILDVETGKVEHKFIRDCTRDDLLAAAAYRREQAAANLANAEKLEGLAEKLRLYRCAQVSDLPRDVLEEEL